MRGVVAAAPADAVAAEVLCEPVGGTSTSPHAHLVHLHEKNSQDRVILPSFGDLQPAAVP
jgi:hypothetical protein